jgi:hypothetical protein
MTTTILAIVESSARVWRRQHRGRLRRATFLPATRRHQDVLYCTICVALSLVSVAQRPITMKLARRYLMVEVLATEIERCRGRGCVSLDFIRSIDSIDSIDYEIT